MVTGSKKDLVVVGAGIIGLSTAYYALKRGWNVTVIDRIEPDGDNCSLGNNGMVVPSHFVPLAAPGVIGQALRWMRDPESPFSLRPSLSYDMFKWGIQFYLASTQAQVDQAAPLLRDLHLASRKLYLEWKDNGIECELAEKGLLMLCRTQEALAHETSLARQSEALGVPAEVFAPQDIASLDPSLKLDVAGGVYYPNDCHLNPAALSRSLRSAIETLGGKFLWGRHAMGWSHNGSRISALTTQSEELQADEFVVAGGVWSDELVKKLRVRIPLLAGKGYSLTLPKPVELPSVCSILCEAKVAVTPIGDSLRFGGTMTLGAPDNVVVPEKIRGIIKSVGDYLPSFTADAFESIEPWVGLRPVSPDGLPYIGRTSEWKNLSIATGHAMMGISLGPITGKLITEIIAGEKTSVQGIDEQLSPNRYAS